MSSSKPGSTKGKNPGRRRTVTSLLKIAREKRLHEVDQVRDGDVAIDHHAFELIERVFVRGVDFFVAEDSSGRDHF